MSVPIVQTHSIILPAYHPLKTEHEDIDDLVCHISTEFNVTDIEEKTIQIVAIENVAAGVPGPLWCWVEISPVLSTVSVAYWAAIGGGGNIVVATLLPYIVPTAPIIEAGTGVDGTPHSIIIPWVIHSSYARLVIQTPVNAALATAYWQVQAIIKGKTP